MKIPAPFLPPWVATLACAVTLAGCVHHDVTFQNSDWHYQTGGVRIDRSIYVVIEPATLEQKVPIHSATVGIANVWDAQPGEMLKQVAGVEFPQSFTDCHMVDAMPALAPGSQALVLELSMRHYAFEHYQARLTMHARATISDGRILFEKDYASTGPAQVGKMYLAGAFGMKSAVRQSSLAAFQSAFVELRSDLTNADQDLRKSAAPGGTPAPTQ